MKVEFDPTDLEPLVRQVASSVVDQLRADEQQLPEDRLSYTEPEAAALLGVERHRLRDARLRGEVDASKIGKVIVYERSDLLRFLKRNRAKTG